MQQIKGTVLKSRLAFVEEHAGAGGLQRVVAALSPEDQRELRNVLPVKWYPFPLGERLDDAIVQVLAGGQPSFFIRLGEASAERNLATVHKGFVTPGHPQAFLAKAPVIYSMYYETGRRDYEKTGKNEAVLTTRDAETYSAPDCLTVMGWYRKALQICGATAVQVREEECRAKGGAVCRYRVSWA